jgi:hypothetical protein
MAIEKSRNLGSEIPLLQYGVTDESIAGIDDTSQSALPKYYLGRESRLGRYALQ